MALLIISSTVQADEPIRWSVYTNTQQYQLTFVAPRSGIYSWSCTPQTPGYYTFWFGPPFGSPLVYVGPTTQPTGGQVTLVEGNSYRLGTDSGNVPVPGTCICSVLKNDWEPTGPGSP